MEEEVQWRRRGLERMPSWDDALSGGRISLGIWWSIVSVGRMVTDVWIVWKWGDVELYSGRVSWRKGGELMLINGWRVDVGCGGWPCWCGADFRGVFDYVLCHRRWNIPSQEFHIEFHSFQNQKPRYHQNQPWFVSNFVMPQKYVHMILRVLVHIYIRGICRKINPFGWNLRNNVEIWSTTDQQRLLNSYSYIHVKKK